MESYYITICTYSFGYQQHFPRKCHKFYENENVKLSVVGGKAKPKNPKPGDTVTITLNKKQKGKPFLFWQSDPPIELTQPYDRTVQFCMPPNDLKIIAKPKKY